MSASAERREKKRNKTRKMQRHPGLSLICRKSLSILLHLPGCHLPFRASYKLACTMQLLSPQNLAAVVWNWALYRLVPFLHIVTRWRFSPYFPFELPAYLCRPPLLKHEITPPVLRPILIFGSSMSCSEVDDFPP